MAQSIEDRREKRRVWREANRELVRQRWNEWRKKNVEHARAKSQKWRDENPEASRAKARESYAKHKEARRNLRETRREILRARGRAWRKANLEMDAAKVRRRYARKRGASGSHTLQAFLSVCGKMEWLCAYCAKPLTCKSVTEDHITPISRGGSDDISNITPACRSCNSRKGRLTSEEFLASRVAV